MNHTTHFHLVPGLKMCVKLYLHSSIRLHGVVINEALTMLWSLLRQQQQQQQQKCSAVSNCMERRPWKASSRSTSQQIPRILCKPDVQFRVHRAHHWSLSRTGWIKFTLCNRLSLRSFSMLVSHSFKVVISPLKWRMHFTSPIRATCLAQIVLSLSC